jgi:mannose-6-phosphate isomerase-like protein (cupin superfamily)
MAVTEPVRDLVAAIRHIWANAASRADIGEDISDLLAATVQLPATHPRAPDPASAAALAWLPPASGGPLGEICALTKAAASALPWHYSYNSEDGLAARIAFADLLGPEGPLKCDHIRLGLTLVAPHTLYAMHAHPARELYYIVAGHAAWTAGTVIRHPPPGDFVLHPSGVPHAMQTAADALLAVYVWRGDIMTAPFYTKL